MSDDPKAGDANKKSSRLPDVEKIFRESIRQRAQKNPVTAYMCFLRAAREGDVADVKEWLGHKMLHTDRTPEGYILRDGIRDAVQGNRVETLQVLIDTAKKENIKWDGPVIFGQHTLSLTEAAAEWGSDRAAKILVDEGAELHPRSLFRLMAKATTGDRRAEIARHYLAAGVDVHEKTGFSPPSKAEEQMRGLAMFFTPFAVLSAMIGEYREPDISPYDAAKKLKDNPVAQAIVEHVRAQRPPSLGQKIRKFLAP